MTKKHQAAGEDTSLETPVWENISGVWQPIYGGFDTHGVSIEWHDFLVADELAWSPSFHEQSLEICLNYGGAASIQTAREPHGFSGEQAAIYTNRDDLVRATRESTSGHRFFTIELTAEYLRRQFAQTLDGLEPAIRQFLDRPEGFAPWLKVFPLPAALLGIRPQLLHPPVNKSALETWYQGKILEVLAQTLFRPDKPAELFCYRYKRVNKERVERVKYLLERDLENPPSLEMLGAEVCCSPFYLSRLFAEEMGLSIPKYLRLKRIERAADLIVHQGLSVTEAGISVGYSSLSAFHRAFLERFGVSPGVYALKDKR